ncbi:unnamed protein product [Ceratitis capitata]|uniref:(Mediterranean fruit fly) hypothetical protein n=1 Tax=Ceratitis capitata TaxID=7213 RepID=A0A811U4T4_CERCA|nr:unnamed protein product [Ceratitis capitata]
MSPARSSSVISNEVHDPMPDLLVYIQFTKPFLPSSRRHYSLADAATDFYYNTTHQHSSPTMTLPSVFPLFFRTNAFSTTTVISDWKQQFLGTISSAINRVIPHSSVNSAVHRHKHTTAHETTCRHAAPAIAQASSGSIHPRWFLFVFVYRFRLSLSGVGVLLAMPSQLAGSSHVLMSVYDNCNHVACHHEQS